MKKSNFYPGIGVLLVLFLMFFYGCDKSNEENNPVKSYFSYEGKDYELSKGYVMMDTMNGEGLNKYVITYFSDGIQIHWKDEEHTVIDSISGLGNILFFVLFSSSPDGPADGTYDPVPDHKSVTEHPWDKTWTNGMAFIVYNDDQGDTKETKVFMKTGRIFVEKKSNGHYDIRMRTVTTDNKDFIAYTEMGLIPFKGFSKK